jgi:hypothetical protein
MRGSVSSSCSHSPEPLRSVRFCNRYRDSKVWRDAAEYYGLFISICVIGALAAYPVAAISTGFADSALERVDHFLRFDWLAWYRFVVEHPAISGLSERLIKSIFFTPAVLFAYYAWSARRAEARQFILSFWLAAFLLLLFFHVPAKGPLAFLWHGPLPYVPESALYQADLIPALRSHAAKPIDLGRYVGWSPLPASMRRALCSTSQRRGR